MDDVPKSTKQKCFAKKTPSTFTLPHLRLITKQPIEDAVSDLLGLPFKAVTCQNSSEFKFGDLPRFEVMVFLTKKPGG